MGNKGNFLVVFLIILFIAVSNIYIYFSKAEMSISGFSIKSFSANISKLDASTILFIIQWVLILAIVFVFYIKFLKVKKEKGKPLNIRVEREKGTGKTHTDIDELYDLLKERRHLKVSDIAKIFKISIEKALEWCKILEEHNLSNLDYPAFSEPEVIIKE